MTLEEVRIILKKELMEINLMNVEQSERSQLTFQSLEKYRQASNRIRIKEEQMETKRIQTVISGWKNDKKSTDVSTKEYFKKIRKDQTREHLKSLVGTEKFQEFIEKFGGKKDE